MNRDRVRGRQAPFPLPRMMIALPAAAAALIALAAMSGRKPR